MVLVGLLKGRFQRIKCKKTPSRGRFQSGNLPGKEEINHSKPDLVTPGKK
jgi:hypothetical protein